MQEVFVKVGYMGPLVYKWKVSNTLHVHQVFFQSWIYGPPGIQVQSIEFFARARRIFSKYDIWTPRYLCAKYWILCMCKKYFFDLDIWIPRYSGAKYWIHCTCKKYFFVVGYMDPRVFRCIVLNTLHVKEVFFWIWIYGPQGI